MTDDRLCEPVLPILEQARGRVTHAVGAWAIRRTVLNSASRRFHEKGGHKPKSYNELSRFSTGDKSLYLPLTSGCCGRLLRALAEALTRRRWRCFDLLSEFGA